MTSRSARLLTFTAMAISGAVLVPHAEAQAPTPAQIAQNYATNAPKNAQLLHQYTWQERVAITYKGDPKPAKLYQISWDASGQQQKTPIGGDDDAGKSRGLRGKIKEEKVDEMKQWATDLGGLLKQYMAPTPGQVMDFFSKATVAPGAAGTVVAKGAGWAVPGDQVTYTIDGQTKQLKSMDIATKLQDDAITATMTYNKVPDGPSYVEQAVINAPSKNVVMQMNNSNFVKQP